MTGCQTRGSVSSPVDHTSFPVSYGPSGWSKRCRVDPHLRPEQRQDSGSHGHLTERYKGSAPVSTLGTLELILVGRSPRRSETSKGSIGLPDEIPVAQRGPSQRRGEQAEEPKGEQQGEARKAHQDHLQTTHPTGRSAREFSPDGFGAQNAK